jgi:hypothetical protein
MDMSQVRVRQFLGTPWHLERFLSTGVAMCTRAFMSTVLLWMNVRECSVLISSFLAVLYIVDSSRWYHVIRGQSSLKLYVLYNVLEVGDKLCSSFGLDILDALGHDASPYLLLPVALLYAVIHTTILCLHVLTLNVAVNSNSHSLLTLLVSNQFVELKSSVFKKFDADSLFQLSCAGILPIYIYDRLISMKDAVERFQLLLYVNIVAIRNWSSGGMQAVRLLQGPVVAIFASELLVDWLKHAFITKFNHLMGASVYAEYGASMQRDRLGRFRNDPIRLARRCGFPCLPLACLLLKTIFEAAAIDQERTSIIILSTVAVGISAMAIIRGLWIRWRANKKQE